MASNDSLPAAVPLPVSEPSAIEAVISAPLSETIGGDFSIDEDDVAVAPPEASAPSAPVTTHRVDSTGTSAMVDAYSASFEPEGIGAAAAHPTSDGAPVASGPPVISDAAYSATLLSKLTVASQRGTVAAVAAASAAKKIVAVQLTAVGATLSATAKHIEVAVQQARRLSGTASAAASGAPEVPPVAAADASESSGSAPALDGAALESTESTLQPEEGSSDSGGRDAITAHPTAASVPASGGSKPSTIEVASRTARALGAQAAETVHVVAEGARHAAAVVRPHVEEAGRQIRAHAGTTAAALSEHARQARVNMAPTVQQARAKAGAAARVGGAMLRTAGSALLGAVRAPASASNGRDSIREVSPGDAAREAGASAAPAPASVEPTVLAPAGVSV